MKRVVPLLLAVVCALAWTATASAARYVSRSGSDGSRCTKSNPCRSFERAYRVARPGETVVVRGGTYGSQQIPFIGSRKSWRNVVFRPARGARVVVGGGGVNVYGRHVSFRSMRFTGGWYAKPGSADVAFRRIWSKDMFITSARNIRVIGGRIGPGRGENYDSQIKSEFAGAPPPRNIVISRVLFDNWFRPASSGNHTECLQIGSGVNVTITRSRFKNCATHDVFIRSWGRGFPLRNFRIENNYFDATLDGYYSLKISDQDGIVCSDFLVRNNSALQNMFWQCNGRSVRFYSNLQPSMRSYACSAQRSDGVVFKYNIWRRGVKCGSTNRRGRLGFRNPRRFDLRLRAGAPAINRGHPTSYPGSDIQGERRPKGRRIDVGADERA